MNNQSHRATKAGGATIGTVPAVEDLDLVDWTSTRRRCSRGAGRSMPMKMASGTLPRSKWLQFVGGALPTGVKDEFDALRAPRLGRAAHKPRTHGVSRASECLLALINGHAQSSSTWRETPKAAHNRP